MYCQWLRQYAFIHSSIHVANKSLLRLKNVSKIVLEINVDWYHKALNQRECDISQKMKCSFQQKEVTDEGK